MSTVRKANGLTSSKKRSLGDPLERSYRQKVKAIRGLTARQASAKDLDLCAKWMYVFSRATKEEGQARDYLLEQMLRQLRESGHLSLPFCNLANCNLELRLLLDEEGRQRLHRSCPPQVVAPKPSSSSLARRRIQAGPFEWRRRVQHLDLLENQYWREEQEMWNLELPSEDCPRPKPPPILVKPKKVAKTLGIQVDVQELSPRAERDLCERERKQREILKRRERDRVERQLREQKRQRHQALLAEQQKQDRQRLEKARQQRDRRVREQQLKVKERRDYERCLLLKKREEQRLQEPRSLAQRRPYSPSSEDVELVQAVGQHLQKDLNQEPKRIPEFRQRSESAMTLPADSEGTKSSRRDQQLHLRAENIKRKVLAYERLKEYHRKRAWAERERQLRKRELKEPGVEIEALQVKNPEEAQSLARSVMEALESKMFVQKDSKKKMYTDGKEDVERTSELDHKRLQELHGREDLERNNLEKQETIDRKERNKCQRKRHQDTKYKKESKAETYQKEDFVKNSEGEIKTHKNCQNREGIGQEVFDRKREQELRALEDRREREEIERKVIERLESKRKEREDFEPKRQQELRSLKERQEREEFERKELEKRLEKDRKEKEDLERKREQDLKRVREWEEFERKVLEKLENERKGREDFERRAWEDRQREERTIEELKASLKEVKEREIRRAEEQERIAREKRELERREREECERMAKEEELLRERRLLEKLKRKKSEREELERKAREEDLKREQILRRWLEMQEEEEKREAKEREEQQERLVEECGKRIQETEAERKVKEDLDRSKGEALLKERQEQERSKLEEKRLRKIAEENIVIEEEEEQVLREKLSREQKDWDHRIEHLRQSREKGIQVESETWEAAWKLKKHLERRLDLNRNDEIRQSKSVVTKSRSQVKSDKDMEPRKIKGKSKSHTQNVLFENPPADMKNPGSARKDVLNRVHKLEKKNSMFNEEIQVPEELRLDAGQLSEQSHLTRAPQRRSLTKVHTVNPEQTPKEACDEDWNNRQRGTQKPGGSSSHEYFDPGSLKSRSERWARFMGSEEKSESEDLPRQRRHPGSSSSAENHRISEPRYSLVGRYCPHKKSYTVEQQNVPPSPYGNPEQREAYGSYVRNRVAEWRKMLGPISSSGDEELGEERLRGGGLAGDVGLTYCTRTGKKRYPQIKQPDPSGDQFGLKENRVQQRRVFRELLTQARTSDYHPDILDAENCLLEKKLSEGKDKATNHYVQESILLVARRLINMFQGYEAYASSEEDNESQGSEAIEQIYLQEIESRMKLPRPIFKTLMEVLFLSKEHFMTHLVEKISTLDAEIAVHLQKICKRVFCRQGAEILRRNAEQLMAQERHLQSRHLAEMCRDSEEETLRQWRRLPRNSLLVIRSLFHDYCDMRDALPRVTLETIERLYGEWKARRFTVD
ncbi:trichohyalin [Drosophila biarmipes]|uniref:trichohyalin n=1 Tax=Drosophila biarmipes TaxID=125945 RepID=UPI0021CC845C|nr:trichohyalin [Drosophila biarmipes]